MGLLRNASGLIIPSVVHHGLQGRADDPEFHISRLNHFGKGMGLDLASVHPHFSGKTLYSTGNSEHEELEFSSHDEGLQLPRGRIDAASTTASSVTDYDPGVKARAGNEIAHRGPYQHWVDAGIPEVPDEDFSISEDIIKRISNGKSSELPRGELLRSSWNVPRRNRTQGYNPNFDTHKDAMKDIRSRFQEGNRNRQGTSADVSDLVSRSINNPDSNKMGRIRRVTPHMLGSQFLGVNYSDSFSYSAEDDINDVIDLKTGNWAKIDPEGYFPD
jgi:hypothetical protein